MRPSGQELPCVAPRKRVQLRCLVAFRVTPTQARIHSSHVAMRKWFEAIERPVCRGVSPGAVRFALQHRSATLGMRNGPFCLACCDLHRVVMRRDGPAYGSGSLKFESSGNQSGARLGTGEALAARVGDPGAPEALSPDARRTCGRTWRGGVRASRG